MRLNLGNETELYMVAADLRCHITDLYVAVATVGDRLEDVARFIARTASAKVEEAAAMPFAA